jgi:hypothetical protein
MHWRISPIRGENPFGWIELFRARFFGHNLFDEQAIKFLQADPTQPRSANVVAIKYCQHQP